MRNTFNKPTTDQNPESNAEPIACAELAEVKYVEVYLIKRDRAVR